ncbi:MAG: alpha/beta hydrolase [Microthrixaceae bacterium]
MAEQMPSIEEVVPEQVAGLDLPLGHRVHLVGRGRTFVREVPGPRPDAPTVVLLHGWVASGGLNWFRCFEPLSEHFRVVAPDLRGHGRGIRSRRRFRLADCADDVAALCWELGVEQAIFCGYSMGGPVAQLMWRRHPDLVSGLVLAATSFSFVPALQQRLAFAGAMAAMAGTTRTTQALTRLPGPVRSVLPAGSVEPNARRPCRSGPLKRCAATTCAWCSRRATRSRRSRRGVGSVASTFRPRSS